MFRNLRWVNCFASKKVHSFTIKEFEYKFDIKLPQNYIEIISEYNTTYPEVKSSSGQWQNGQIKIENFKAC